MLRRKYREIYYFFCTYKLKFINSFRFMSTSLSKLVNNLSEIYIKECRGCKERKKIVV